MLDFNQIQQGFDAHDKFMGRIPETRADALARQLRPMSDLRPDLSSRYLVKGWLDAGALSVVYGDANVGKTFFALDMAFRVAAGTPWNGNRVKAGAVVYIAAEGGRGLASRIEAVRRADPDLADRAEENLSILTAPINLSSLFDAEALVEVLAPQRPALIVIDTLARCMGEGDENSARDMGLVIRSLDRIRAETGAHVMVVHHSGKDASRGARGSGSLRAAVDTEIELTREDGVIAVEARKQRDMAMGKPVHYRLEDVEIGIDGDGDAVTSAVLVGAEPVVRKPKISGQAEVGMQALFDALASSTARTAFFKVKSSLLDKGLIRIADGYVWSVQG